LYIVVRSFWSNSLNWLTSRNS